MHINSESCLEAPTSSCSFECIFVALDDLIQILWWMSSFHINIFFSNLIKHILFLARPYLDLETLASLLLKLQPTTFRLCTPLESLQPHVDLSAQAPSWSSSTLQVEELESFIENQWLIKHSKETSFGEGVSLLEALFTILTYLFALLKSRVDSLLPLLLQVLHSLIQREKCEWWIRSMSLHLSLHLKDQAKVWGDRYSWIISRSLPLSRIVCRL